METLPQPEYLGVAAELRRHYAVCSAFTTPHEQLASPPSHLDLFKDARVTKSWRDGTAIVLISLNSLLRVWTDLMPTGWNATHVARDVVAILAIAKPMIKELHASFEESGRRLSLQGVFQLVRE